MRRTSSLVALVTAMITGAGLTACEPPPPRLQLAVTTTLADRDDNPGDGNCFSTAAGGCSLQAAIGEGNTAAHGADISVPPGAYAAFSAAVVGDVRITAAAPSSTRFDDGYGVHLTVGSAGRLEVTDLNTDSEGFPGSFQVAVDGSLTRGGTFIARRSVLSAGRGVVPSVPLLVVERASAVLIDSLVHSPEYQSVVNRGTLVAINSSLLTSFNFTALDTIYPGISVLVGSAIARFDVFPGDGAACDGEPPTSLGYVHIEEPCGSDPTGTDSAGNAGYHISDTARPHMDPSSPLVDAIPVTDPACNEGSLDVYGNLRGVDGNGDGIPGCDIGGIERQPSPDL